jgi:hypothetical protein
MVALNPAAVCHVNVVGPEGMRKGVMVIGWGGLRSTGRGAKVRVREASVEHVSCEKCARMRREITKYALILLLAGNYAREIG